MEYKRVAILRGGPSEEYQVSMRTGANVLRAIKNIGNPVTDVVITKKGEWLQSGIVKKPEQVLASTDIVFLGLHGSYGEDGEVQKIIQRHNLPFTGSRAFPSAVAFNKHLTKETLFSHGLTMPKHRIISSDEIDSLSDIVNEIQTKFGPEYIIKPVASGSSVGITLVKEGQSLKDKLTKALEMQDRLMVEEYIRGREATCATLEDFRNESIYVFPAIEIIPPSNSDFFSAEVKYNGETKEICPGNFSYQERVKLAEASVLVHDVLGLSQYSRSDFIIKNGQVYFLEVNTLPGLTEESLYPKAALAVGLSFDQLVRFLLETATP